MLHRRYTRAVAATQIAQNLAFVNWTVLTGLAFGSFAAVVLLRRRTTATPGYLRFTTICAVGFGIRYKSPVGPIRVDVGFKTKSIDPGPSFVLHFSVGNAF